MSYKLITMSRKFKLIADQKIVEVPTIKEPIDRGLVMNRVAFDLEVARYNQHIQSLHPSPITLSSLLPEWKEGDVLEEGKDLVIGWQVYSTHFTNDEWKEVSKDEYHVTDPGYRRLIAHPVENKVVGEDKERDFELLAEYDMRERLTKTIHHCLTKMPEENREVFIVNLCNGMVGSAILHYRNKHEKKMNIKPFNQQM